MSEIDEQTIVMKNESKNTKTDNSLNIVELIEKNPIIKITNTYNNTLLSKIKENFSEFQQQLFVSSLYCRINYDQTNDFVISLDDIWEWLGFSQKVRAYELLQKNFTLDKDYKKMNKKEKKNGRGGHNKDIIMMNIQTFQSLCLKSCTNKSNEIQQYFIKLENLLYNHLQEETVELKNQLLQINVNTAVQQKRTQELDREKILLREFGKNGSIVYIIRVKTFENGNYIIKIGESRKGISQRYNEHKTNYGGEILLLDCFSVKKSNEFERFIHDKIYCHRYTELPGHEKEHELFLIGKELSYDMLLQYIHTHIKQFDDYNDLYVEKLHTENETLKGIIEMNEQKQTNTTVQCNHDVLQKILDNQTIMMNHIHQLEKTNKEIMEKTNKLETKNITQFNEPLKTVGPKLQKINPETMNLVKLYDSVAECLKESNFELKRPSINKAVLENTIYKGFRWALVDRDVEYPNIVTVQPTKPTRPQNLGYIAKLNQDKTAIVNVYIDRKTAAIQNGYQSASSLDNPVKNKTITNNHYYVLYDHCDDALKQNFVDKVGREPILYKDGIGVYGTNDELRKEYVCKYECIKQMKISDRTLGKVLDKPVLYNNHYFRRIGEKLFV